MSTFPSDIEIAQRATLQHIRNIAEKINIPEDDLEYYGKYKAKLPLSLQSESPKGKLILVSAMSPTKYGEGKTTMSIGLTDGLNCIGKKAIGVLREPSLGPVFGLKGGAAGGGYAQVVPMEDINLHFTGDFSAIEKANNLLSAVIDNNLQNPKYSLNLDPKSIAWKRVMDMNDRSLRQIIIGVGTKANGTMREDGFNITPASEVMAILCLSKDIEDLKVRLGTIYVGKTLEGKAIFARDLNVVGAMAVLLKDALKPNLVQTLEGNPAILHGGPFASIAQGTNTVIATKMGLSLGDYVVTEAGFGADLGAEKFFHIKCGQSGLKPDAVVLVATVRAIKHHAGLSAEEFKTENTNAIEKGFCNLEKHIENIQKFGINPVVCINAFPDDTQAEYEVLKALCLKKGVTAIVSTAFVEGGKGSAALAEKVIEEINKGQANYQPLYQKEDALEHKITTIAKEIYGARSVAFSPKSKSQLKMINDLGFNEFSVCMAKTPASFSDNEKLIGRPTDFDITVREFEIASGAGFIVPLLGDVMRMPGLPAIPNAERMDIDTNGKISGLS
ncbi:formate--tetrahydrofolate ligase [Flavobacterium aciduliphilum]|uniref:Formate--tetrahydrofolate ligase n=1 Tax=Flavobacterium aciduliphilum TaxID=1101402 RepID=A0A328YQX9_9FLAO|nr:formate--tetrahydrofolate ligase [Flavobacterium aciduliphilum]RAR75533.1 formate-tetrahydrofolate ligase [Flavobacterium aciduliphilum]